MSNGFDDEQKNISDPESNLTTNLLTGLVLFGLSAEVWRTGAKDWVLGFCCCAFLVALVSIKGDFRALLRTFGSFKKERGRRKKKPIFRISCKMKRFWGVVEIFLMHVSVMMNIAIDLLKVHCSSAM
ncbi:hypothetical protein C2S51_027117 [Perilla frutescens var. frutescens]|nr:hypothetical protein C2S51_027117 [Perilla frutescens var. frutescens]